MRKGVRPSGFWFAGGETEMIRGTRRPNEHHQVQKKNKQVKKESRGEAKAYLHGQQQVKGGGPRNPN